MPASTPSSANPVRQPIMDYSAASIDFTNFNQAEPRDWHVIFARRSLREVVFEQTEKLLGGLSDPARIERVPAAIMRRVAQDLARAEAELLPHASGIRMHKRMLGMVELFVFEMPSPQAPGEACFAGVVNAYTMTPRMHYFTLERGKGRQHGLLAWDAAGGQQRIGGNIQAMLDRFVDAVAAHMDSLLSHASPSAPAGVVVIPQDGISRDTLNAETLSALFDRAAVDAQWVASHQYRIRDLGIEFQLTLPKTRSDHLTLCRWWATDPEIPLLQRLNVANRINLEYLYIRASIDEDGDLYLSQHVPVLSGISGKFLAAVLRNFANACREAMLEYGNAITSNRERE